jgi:hypothetical protein
MNINGIIKHITKFFKMNNTVKTETSTKAENMTTWTKKNHGGEPTPNKDKKRAVFIGRFQPPSVAHLALIDQKLNEGVPALVMVRDIEPDEKNPFTTEQTVFLLEKYYKAKNQDVEVMVIPDIESVNYGRGVGYEINEFTPPENLKWISATKIRQSIKDNDSAWKEMVDESIQEDVKLFLQTNEIVSTFEHDKK